MLKGRYQRAELMTGIQCNLKDDTNISYLAAFTLQYYLN
jgi:hypothetical protein